MRTLSSKALLAALNPSPVFEAVAIFAEQLVLKGDEAWPSESERADNFAWRSGETNEVRILKKTALPLSGI